MKRPPSTRVRTRHACRLSGAAIIFILVLLVFPARAEVLLPGVTQANLEPHLKGRLLLEELHCAACHAPPEGTASTPKPAPRLADLADRAHPAYIEAFIRSPHTTKPGTPMPDALAGMSEPDRAHAARDLTHYLRSLRPGRFAPEAPDAVAAALGERLFHSRGCAACHSPRDAEGRETFPAQSVPLGALEMKYSFRSLVDFLSQPHRSRPAGRMPDLRLPGRELDCIAHYLLRKTAVPGNLAYTMYKGEVWQGIGHETVEPERAGITNRFSLDGLERIHHHMAVRFEGWLNLTTAGEYAFFLKANGATLTVDGREILSWAPKDRRGTQSGEGRASLGAGWRRVQLDYYHTGREPALSLDFAGPGMARGPIPSALLSISNNPIPPFAPAPVDRESAVRGRERFAQLGCARCHDDLGVTAPAAQALTQLDPTRGCLAPPGSRAKGVHFDLSAGQREWITAALRTPSSHPSAEQALHVELARLNCLACHERRGLGGIPPERNALFTGSAPALGDQGRLPPTLSDVGAKLTPSALEDVLLRGHRQRPYLDAAMPQYGEANVRKLIQLFSEVDRLEAVQLPALGNLQESRNAGYEMVGVKGFSCIACHDFNGQKSAGAGALDLVNLTQRIQRNWFHLYMRSPQRFHPGIIMPSYWPGGLSPRPDLLGGDSSRQIDALWQYLEAGTSAKNPLGLSRQSRELRVTDVAEIARGRSSIGYRGLAVGYPGRISLVFDTEEMALRQLWKGEFTNIDLGSFQPRAAGSLITLPAGVPFHRLAAPDDAWPAKGKTTFGFPQNLGYQFRGYELDAKRPPTLRYESGDLKVEDRFEEVLEENGSAFFRRALKFTAPAGVAPFYFRVGAGTAVSATVNPTGARSYSVDRLQIRVRSGPEAIIREGELLLPLTPPAGTSLLTLEYQW